MTKLFPSLLESMGHDLRHAARGLLRTPAFTIPAVLTLALGIGANSAIFTVVNAVLLKPLPYADPDSRAMIWSRWTDYEKTWVSLAEVLDYRNRTRTLADVAAWSSGQVNLTGDGEPVRIGAAFVTVNTFAVLGAAPMPGLGRTFDEAEAAADPPNVVVIGHGLWQSHYGADPAVIGQSILVDGQAAEVVGVMPPGFKLPTDYGEDAAEPTELWMPFAIDRGEAEENRGNHGFFAAARLKPGVTAEAASVDLAAVTADLTRDGLYPEAMQFGAFVVALEDEIAGAVRPAVLLLAGAVAFLLLIACANVASLLLARAEARQREMALRAALGAGTRRLLRQLLVEGLLLAALAAVCGLVLAELGLRALVAIDPTAVPRVDEIAIDGRVQMFTVVLAMVTTLLFSFAPALRALRTDLVTVLKGGGAQGTIGVQRQRLRSFLVVTEMALAVVLVIGAALMIRSLAALQRVDLGFDPERVLTSRLTLPEASYETPEQMVGFYARLLERVRSLPDVRHAGLVRSLPLSDVIGDWSIDVEGFVELPGVSAKGDWQVASDGSFEALGERLIRGRLLRASDTTDAQPVAVINETMAQMYWRDRDPIGGRFRLGSDPERPFYTVVGIVGDLRHSGVDAVVKEKFYIPYTQFHLSGVLPVRGMTLVVKTSRDPQALAPPIRRLVDELDPRLPIADVRPMTDVVGTALATPRFTGWLLTLFAGLALALSAVGIYGVLAYLVSQRTHEIGIRLAIGASRSRVVRTVLARGLALSLAGIAAGLLMAWWLTRLMTNMLYGIEPHDAATFAGVAVALLLVALVASHIPARRAMRVDPIRALRAE